MPRPRRPTELEANLTPMIDVTFLLIVFFVLVSQIVEVENVDLALPVLEEPATQLPGEEQRAVVNIVPDLGRRAREIRLGGQVFPPDAGGVAAFGDRLGAMLAANPSMRVNVRADQHTDYEWIQPVLEAIGRAGAMAGTSPRVNLVVVREE